MNALSIASSSVKGAPPDDDEQRATAKSGNDLRAEHPAGLGVNGSADTIASIPPLIAPISPTGLAGMDRLGRASVAGP